MKNALYYQEDKPPVAFVVLKENADGTVDIGLDGKPAVVTSCVVSDTPLPGQCAVGKVADDALAADAEKIKAADKAAGKAASKNK
jgi:hypothetical protein